MFSKKIEHPFFKELTRGLLGYSGKLDVKVYKNIEILIKGRSKEALEVALFELSELNQNLDSYRQSSTKEAFDAYEVMKDLVDSGEFDIEADGGQLPKVEKPEEVWNHMVLEEIWVEPKEKYKTRLSFRCPWDIEHDFGIYISNNQYQYSGISV